MARKTVEDEVRELRRGLAFYRGVVVVMLLATIGVGFWFSRDRVSEFGHAGEVWTLDLDERVAEIERTKGEKADFSETYFQTDGASVHMHFMGHEQTTPLHIHPRSEEATIIAGGKAEVTSIWGEGGSFQQRQWSHEVGSLVGSPRFTAHEFHNPNADRMLANLVFTMPLWGGNFYVHPDDPRILKGTPPFGTRVADDLPAFVAGGEPSRLTATPAMQGHVHELLVATSWTLPANGGKPVVAYVASGEGTVEGHRLAPNVLAHLESTSPVTIAATAGHPLALVLFDPLGALPASTAAP